MNYVSDSGKSVPQVPTIIDMGAYCASPKESYRVIRDDQGKFILLNHDGSLPSSVKKRRNDLNYFYITN